MIRVNPSLCPQDHPCPMIKRCPQGAISQKGFNAPGVGSGECAEPRDAPFV
ncbi:MAG: 4Fe-4S ferredoxin [Candidatus Altiarchaeota archaeon]|nr:4Fe-4S ferredoxin [Candidatus Altiarchaeota archaeon]